MWPVLFVHNVIETKATVINICEGNIYFELIEYVKSIDLFYLNYEKDVFFHEMENN